MNRIRVQLADKEYVVVTERDEAFVKACAERLNYELTGILTSASGVRVADAALLCAMNFLDERAQFEQSSEDLKRQLKECFEEAARQRAELDELGKAMKELREELKEKNAELARRGKSEK